ncbi:Fe-S cluster biogenesis protein NfuA [Nonlabens dokdonensis]|uniref:NifU-like domain protein n=2 Tax=Nonlabens dokdonensis TaxID=328515 RepID=L7WCS8_NONDD|nr:NifU family protein [Nonlabens dokdonensis]AGC76713.1 NifU-like domain protein [Nonlabens dokdonensis DSW-6]PZX44360.1 Fe-S cluster biogenesis protein NfuA [Nonlabens dokdonensis]
MKKHEITIIPTSNEAIIKFESNHFLVKNHSYEFKNIDEAKPSPLAQQLFYLPFVKTVYIAQNFIAIERYDIVAWDDVKSEVADQISEYLNSGEVLIKSEEEKKKVPVTVYAEATPNPNAMKFVANKKLTVNSKEFKSINDTETDTLPRALYSFPFIKEIYVDENYISIQKHDVVSWDEVTHEVRSFIRESLESGKSIGETKHESAAIVKEKGETVDLPKFENLDDVSKKIVEILDEYIKPAVASDGGNIVFEGYEESNGEVRVILQGACSGCPSSTMTLRNGIETMLKDMIPGKIDRVVALNG